MYFKIFLGRIPAKAFFFPYYIAGRGQAAPGSASLRPPRPAFEISLFR